MAVSVLLPVKNSDSEYLRLSINSVLEQDFRQFELLVVDSSDTSNARLINQFDDQRIHYFHKPELNGLAEQLNFGIENCRFDLVARMDADDISDSRRLSTQHAFFKCRPDVSLLGSQVTLIDRDGTHLGNWSYPRSGSDIKAAIKSGNPLAHPTVMFRKQAVLDTGGYQEYPGAEDYDLWSRMILNGHLAENTVETLLKYRLHTKSIKSSKVKAAIRSSLAIKEKYWFQEMNLPQKIRFYLEKFLLLMPPGIVYRTYIRMRFFRS